jgi:mannosyltransferase
MIGSNPDSTSRMAPSQVANTNAIASGSQPERASIVHWIALCLIIVTGVAARLECLACKPFWFDECFSAEVTRIDWYNFLHLLWWREANMSLYYVLLRFWMHFGQSPFFIRSLSVAISACSLLAIYWLGHLLYDRRVGLSAAALLAINVYDIRYAQEARSYTLFVLLATLSSAFLISWLRKPSRLYWRGYVIVSILAVYAHFYAMLLLAAHWLALQWTGLPQQEFHSNAENASKSELRRAWIVIGIGVLPLLVFVAKTGAGPIRWIQRPGALDLIQFSVFFTNGFPLIYFPACIAALVPLKQDLFARDGKWETFRVHFLFVWFLFPILLTVLLSFARPVFLPRYMIFCLPAMLILIAAGIASVPPKWLSAALLVGTLIFSARIIPYVYGHDFDDERDATGLATDLILNRAQPGDAIFFHIAGARVPYEFFRSLRAHKNTASPNFTSALGPEIVFPHHGAGLDYRDFTGKPTADLLRATLPNHSRVWVMLMNNGGIEKPDMTTLMLTQVLPETFPKMERWQFTRVELRLYSK